jgi:hypothetical protein
MNASYNKYRAAGYSYTGITVHDWEKEEALTKAKALKVMGNKVVTVRKVEETHFRDTTSKSYWWTVLVKYSEEYKAWMKQEAERKEKERHEWKLRKIADDLTLEDLAWMMKDKVDRMPTEELLKDHLTTE